MKEQIIELLREIRLYISAWIILSFEAFKLKMAIALADIKQKAMNRRYHVIHVVIDKPKKRTDCNEKPGDNVKKVKYLRSINRDEFVAYKRVKWLPKDMTLLDLERVAFYSTPLSRNNTLNREERRKAMRKYMNYQRTNLLKV